MASIPCRMSSAPNTFIIAPTESPIFTYVLQSLFIYVHFFYDMHLFALIYYEIGLPSCWNYI